ncbi:hypothetical protein HPG69_011407 [Diceros bicornis minor]|uniref:Alpha-carbonic anhydrase domain-containing protein n=1 Tax=Diceros bicornis minor TaxID=77932 RepID=A0A7J7FE94_DICBM|nr:hypothetical protein HPG69_011407 [Diceros bicornis minor]
MENETLPQESSFGAVPSSTTAPKCLSKRPLLGNGVLLGGPLPQGHEFELYEVRFHWGRENQRGSEHTVNFKAFPMENDNLKWHSDVSKLLRAQHNTNSLWNIKTSYHASYGKLDFLVPWFPRRQLALLMNPKASTFSKPSLTNHLELWYEIRICASNTEFDFRLLEFVILASWIRRIAIQKEKASEYAVLIDKYLFRLLDNSLLGKGPIFLFSQLCLSLLHPILSPVYQPSSPFISQVPRGLGICDSDESDLAFYNGKRYYLSLNLKRINRFEVFVFLMLKAMNTKTLDIIGAQHQAPEGLSAAECCLQSSLVQWTLKEGSDCRLHLIHWNSTLFGSIDEAVGKSHGIAIIALFVQIGKEHAGLKAVTEILQDIQYKGKSKTIPCFNPNTLLPDPLLRDYWVYEGSLTIPPCSEGVTWILFRYPLTISQLQD